MFLLCFPNPLVILRLLNKGVQTERLEDNPGPGATGRGHSTEKRREWRTSKDGLAFIQVSDNGGENRNCDNWSTIVRVTMELDDGDENYNTH